jgi:hypothetical protein
VTDPLTTLSHRRFFATASGGPSLVKIPDRHADASPGARDRVEPPFGVARRARERSAWNGLPLDFEIMGSPIVPAAIASLTRNRGVEYLRWADQVGQRAGRNCWRDINGRASLAILQNSDFERA